jgi:hypothetical protein
MRRCDQSSGTLMANELRSAQECAAIAADWKDTLNAVVPCVVVLGQGLSSWFRLPLFV